MIRTTIALTIAAAALLLPAPAHAAEDEWPDQLVVMPTAGVEGIGYEDGAWFVDDVGLSPGDVVDIDWRTCQGSMVFTCAWIGGTQLPDGAATFAPAGEEFPAYETPMWLETSAPRALAGHPVHGAGEPGNIEGVEVVWASQQRATDADGVEWVRVGQGASDVWVMVELLEPIDLAEPELEPTDKPDTDQSDEAETPADTPGENQAATDGGARRMWLATGGAVALAAGGALMLARRRNDLEESR